jgi:hypothetical protein
MDPLQLDSRLATRLARVLPLVASAALIALALREAREAPWLAALLALAALGAFAPYYLARRRFRALLLSGDVPRILEVWRDLAGRIPSYQLAEPLIEATTFAAYGWVEEARAQLGRVELGGAFEISAEHRMYIETLLEAFDGDREQAVRMADRVAALPMPPRLGARMRRRLEALRVSLGALTRAFAHRAAPGDLEVLEGVARTSPLVSWAMRYAAAIVAVDEGRPERVRALLSGAPAWPPQSAFRAFHRELAERALERGSPPAAA